MTQYELQEIDKKIEEIRTKRESMMIILTGRRGVSYLQVAIANKMMEDKIELLNWIKGLKDNKEGKHDDSIAYIIADGFYTYKPEKALKSVHGMQMRSINEVMEKCRKNEIVGEENRVCVLCKWFMYSKCKGRG